MPYCSKASGPLSRAQQRHLDHVLEKGPAEAAAAAFFDVARAAMAAGRRGITLTKVFARAVRVHNKEGRS